MLRLLGYLLSFALHFCEIEDNGNEADIMPSLLSIKVTEVDEEGKECNPRAICNVLLSLLNTVEDYRFLYREKENETKSFCVYLFPIFSYLSDPDFSH